MSLPDKSALDLYIEEEQKRHAYELLRIETYFKGKPCSRDTLFNEALLELASLKEKVGKYEDFLRAIKVSPEAVDHYAETGELP